MKFMLERNLLGYDATYCRPGFVTNAFALSTATSLGWQENRAMYLSYMLAVLAALKGEATLRL